MLRGSRIACAAVALAAVAACGAAQPPAFDPFSADAPPDAAHPASMQGLQLQSHGANLNGVIYEAAGAGPHPTLLMLHGFPGNELNQDLAQLLRRAGWNTVTFHYRGSWGSGGVFSVRNVLEDAAAVSEAIRAPEFAASHRIDPTRVSVFGHSMGGFAALMTGAAHPELRCTVSMAGANFGALVAAVDADPALVAVAGSTFQSWGEGPIAGMSGEAMVAELLANRADFDVLARLPALAARPVLLVVATQDVVTPPAVNHEPQLAALRTAGAQQLQELRLEADHAFSGARVALGRGVLDFLAGNCT